jgi:hypothetical protein
MSSSKYLALPIVSLDAYAVDLNEGYGVKNDVIVSQILEYGALVDPEAAMLHDHSHTYYEDWRLPDTDEVNHLKATVTDVMSEIAGRPYTITESWSIVLEPGQSVAAHSHYVHGAINPNEYFAFAYYPFAPEGSVPLQILGTHSNVISSTISAPVSTGTLLIFNSYLLHWTNRQIVDSIRVNVSGNLAPVNPTTVSNDDWSKYKKES